MSPHSDGAASLTAVSRDSLRDGAVVSFSGDTLVESGDGIVAAIASRLTEPAASIPDGDFWLTDAVPAFPRGAAWIVPLAWVPDQDDREDHRYRALRDRVNELWTAVRGACSHRHGNQIGIDLDSVEAEMSPYASELVRTGARRADWWGFGGSAVVLVVYGDPIPAPLSRLAVHVVPIDWVSDRRRTSAKKTPPLDLAWSWTDVVAFATAEDADAAG